MGGNNTTEAEEYMKKNFGIFIVTLMIGTVIMPVSGLLTEEYFDDDYAKRSDTKLESGSSNSFTHTVLAEYQTFETCGACPAAANRLYNIYNSGNFDFYYVSLVVFEQSNPDYAMERVDEFGESAYPHIFVDNTFDRWSAGTQSQYEDKISTCGNRNVKNIDLQQEITWEGDGKLIVTVSVTNNEGSTYYGHLHSYVTEIASRWSCRDHEEPPNVVQYHFAFIGDYPINEDIIVPPGDTLRYRSFWDGNHYGFGDITFDNIMVITSVFDRNNNGYADETIGSTPIYEVSPPGLDQSQEYGGMGIGEEININEWQEFIPTEEYIYSIEVFLRRTDNTIGDIKVYIVKPPLSIRLVEYTKSISSITTEGSWMKFGFFDYHCTKVGPGSTYRLHILGPSQSGVRWGHSLADFYPFGISSIGECCDFQFRIYSVDNPSDLTTYSELDLSWRDIPPGGKCYSTIFIENKGYINSELDWEICEYPDWGTWYFDPSEGEDLKTSHDPVSINLTLIAPEEQNEEFSGYIKVCNKNNPNDYAILDVYLTTPKHKTIFIPNFIQRFLENHPNFFPLLRQLLKI
jgi:hypothetical protein